MQSIQTSHAFPLSSVKPLEELLHYREYCLDATRKALLKNSRRRECSPIGEGPLKSFGNIGGLEYVRCEKTGSFFLAHLPTAEVWARLLSDVTEYRHSLQALHSDITKSRLENVFEPKLIWIQNTLRLHQVFRPKIMEVTTPPSSFTSLLKSSETFSEVFVVNEMDLVIGSDNGDGKMDVAVLLESIDRVDDPTALLRGIYKFLRKNGIVFITAQVSSGFDITVLGVRNAYIYPPDRTNCFSLVALKQFLTDAGFDLLEVSTPGVLDVEVVKAHLQHDPEIALSRFEHQLLNADGDTHAAFQSFLQQCGRSSFARLVAKKGD